MPAMTRRAWLGMCRMVTLAGLAVWAGKTRAHGTLALPAIDEDQQLPFSGKLSPRQRLQRNHLPNVALVTHEGETVRFYDDLVKGRKVAINCMYTRCADGTCPLVTANMAEVQRRMKDRVGRDIFFYSLTLDPGYDTPEVLKSYAEKFGIGPGWHFLTGDPADIERLRRGLGFEWIDPAEDANIDNHTGMILYGTEPLLIWRGVPGLSSPRHILRILLWEFDRPLPRGS